MATHPTIRGHNEDGRALAPRTAGVRWQITDRERGGALEEKLSEMRREHDELRRALFEVAQMQRRLCGPRHLQRGPYTLAGELFPVQHVSGDFLTAFEQESQLIFALGDIAGKGLAAGMWFTHIVGLIRMLIDGRGPAAAMSAINRELCRANFAPPLTSLFLASLNLETDEITYCNAGHPPSLIVRRTGIVEQLHYGGPILGAIPEAPYAAGRVRLGPGDSCLSFSDGIMECRNLQGVQFGTDRLVLAAESATHPSATGKLFSLLGAVKDFVASGQREDDFAVLWLCRDDNSNDPCALQESEVR